MFRPPTPCLKHIPARLRSVFRKKNMVILRPRPRAIALKSTTKDTDNNSEVTGGVAVSVSVGSGILRRWYLFLAGLISAAGHYHMLR